MKGRKELYDLLKKNDYPEADLDLFVENMSVYEVMIDPSMKDCFEDDENSGEEKEALHACLATLENANQFLKSKDLSVEDKVTFEQAHKDFKESLVGGSEATHIKNH